MRRFEYGCVHVLCLFCGGWVRGASLGGYDLNYPMQRSTSSLLKGVAHNIQQRKRNKEQELTSKRIANATYFLGGL